MIEFQRMVERTINEEIVRSNSDVAAGHCDTFDKYRELCGYRSGLEMALTMITEVAQEFHGGK